MKDNLIEKIARKAKLEPEEVEKQVEKKMTEFSGLVSEEGAAYLIAKDLGVDPLKEIQKNELKISNIVPNMRNVSIKAKVIDLGELRTFKRSDGTEGKVKNILLGDETGTIRLSLWDEQIELSEKLEPEQVIELKNGYSKEDNRGNSELRLGRKSLVKQIEEDIIPWVKKGSSASYKKASIREILHENVKYEVEGTLLQMFTKNPFYSVCPSCGKRVSKNESNVYMCEEHGEVEPEKTMVLSGILDDCSGNIRCVFFGDLAYDLLGGKKVSNKEDVEELSKNVEGKRIRILGRSKLNSFFNELEIIVESFESVNVIEKLERYVGVS